MKRKIVESVVAELYAKFPVVHESRSPWQLIKAKDCAALCAISVGNWYKRVKYDPDAPQPVYKKGDEKTGASYWLLREVEAYIRLLIERYQGRKEVAVT